MKALPLCVAAAMLVAGGSAAKTKAPRPPVDTTDMQWSKAPGTNTITGEAMMRTRGGDVKTCAGLLVYALPAGTYSDDFTRMAFGSNAGGLYSPDYLSGKVGLAPEAQSFVRFKTCNSQGRFTFSGLPDGTYYIVAKVAWQAPSRYGLSDQGGDLMRRVEVRGGVTEDVTISQ